MEITGNHAKKNKKKVKKERKGSSIISIKRGWVFAEEKYDGGISFICGCYIDYWL
jgi:hypothetical protein